MEIQLDLLISFLSIIAIDIILGGDNAVVIALASRNLPEAERTKAIVWGTILAVIIRACLTVLIAYLLQIPFLLLGAGILLVFIAFQLVIDKPDKPEVKAGTTIFGAIQTIVFADLIMGLDNIVAIAGASGGEFFLIISGFFFSVPIIIWGSKVILRLLEYFPALIYIGGAVLAFTAARMLTETPQFKLWLTREPLFIYVFWLAVPVAVLVASWITNRTRRHGF